MPIVKNRHKKTLFLCIELVRQWAAMLMRLFCREKGPAHTSAGPFLLLGGLLHFVENAKKVFEKNRKKRPKSVKVLPMPLTRSLSMRLLTTLLKTKVLPAEKCCRRK